MNFSFVKIIFLIALLMLAVFPQQASSLAESNEVIADEDIVEAIESRFKDHPFFIDTKVRISSIDGVVFLEGIVYSSQESSLLITTAESIPGVIEVDASRLRAMYDEEYFKNAYITSTIKIKILIDNIFGKRENVPFWTTHVNTINGKVYLTGEVKNEEQKQRIEDIAKSVKDVKDVESHIKVISP